MRPVRVEVNDRMQRGYVYLLTEPVGRNFHPDFRHVAQVEKNCRRGDVSCWPKQRQALLQWADDSRRILNRLGRGVEDLYIDCNPIAAWQL